MSSLSQSEITEQKACNANPTKFGIDFGGVILKYDGSFMLEENDDSYLQSNQQENAFETIKFIINKYGNESVYIISKAKQKMKKRIKNWLIYHKFYEQTNFKIENTHFVSTFDEKRIKVDQLGINIFIDDKIQNIMRVVGAKTIQKAIWFDCQQIDQIQLSKQNKYKNKDQLFSNNPLIEHIKSKSDRNKVVIAKNWQTVRKILNKVPKYCT